MNIPTLSRRTALASLSCGFGYLAFSALAARAGWRTIFASDAETALATLGTQDGMQLDAVLIDQWSPDFDPADLISAAERPDEAVGRDVEDPGALQVAAGARIAYQLPTS